MAPMVLEIGVNQTGSWDHFKTRNLTIAVQEMMHERFSGDAGNFFSSAREWLRRVLGIMQADRNKPEQIVRRFCSNFVFNTE